MNNRVRLWMIEKMIGYGHTNISSFKCQLKYHIVNILIILILRYRTKIYFYLISILS